MPDFKFWAYESRPRFGPSNTNQSDPLDGYLSQQTLPIMKEIIPTKYSPLIYSNLTGYCIPCLVCIQVDKCCTNRLGPCVVFKMLRINFSYLIINNSSLITSLIRNVSIEENIILGPLYYLSDVDGSPGDVVIPSAWTILAQY